MAIPKKGAVPGRIPYAWKGTAGEWEAFIKGADGGLATTGVDNIIKIDKVSSSVTYIGYAAPGTADEDEEWQLLKMVKTSTLTSILYAEGNVGFVHSFSNRATYNYS
jgi:hypothetical protein